MESNTAVRMARVVPVGMKRFMTVAAYVSGTTTAFITRAEQEIHEVLQMNRQCGYKKRNKELTNIHTDRQSGNDVITNKTSCRDNLKSNTNKTVNLS